MPHRTKIPSEEKIRIVEDCIEGRVSQSEAARRAGADKSTIQGWIARYQSEGGSLQKICKKYKIHAKKTFTFWIKVYNSGRSFNKMRGGSRMKNTRKTSQEERIQIARECIENGNNYGETAIKYQVGYQQVYTWVRKYRELGKAGLEDRHGQRIAAKSRGSDADAEAQALHSSLKTRRFRLNALAFNRNLRLPQRRSAVNVSLIIPLSYFLTYWHYILSGCAFYHALRLAAVRRITRSLLPGIRPCRRRG